MDSDRLYKVKRIIVDTAIHVNALIKVKRIENVL